MGTLTDVLTSGLGAGGGGSITRNPSCVNRSIYHFVSIIVSVIFL